MAKKLPQHVERIRTRHGKSIYYFRVRSVKGPRVRLPDDPASDEFTRRYKAAMIAHLRGELKPANERGEHTLGWLIEQYRESPEYAGLAAETHKQFKYQFARMKARAAKVPLAELSTEGIMKGRAERALKAPSDANKYVRASKKLFDFAVANGWMQENPAKDIGKLPTNKSKNEDGEPEGFKIWSEADVERYEERWPVGTRERLALDLLIYTGVRRSDVVRLGRQHMRKNGEIVIRTQKSVNSGRPVEVTISILPPLARSIEATATGNLTFLCTKRGTPFKKTSFGKWLKEACKAAGVDEEGKAAHGLRKVAATRAAEAGATEAELNAMFGWADGSKESSVYTRTANRAKLARSGSAKVIGISQTFPKPQEETLENGAFLKGVVGPPGLEPGTRRL